MSLSKPLGCGGGNRRHRKTAYQALDAAVGMSAAQACDTFDESGAYDAHVPADVRAEHDDARYHGGGGASAARIRNQVYVRVHVIHFRADTEYYVVPASWVSALRALTNRATLIANRIASKPKPDVPHGAAAALPPEQLSPALQEQQGIYKHNERCAVRQLILMSILIASRPKTTAMHCLLSMAFHVDRPTFSAFAQPLLSQIDHGNYSHRQWADANTMRASARNLTQPLALSLCDAVIARRRFEAILAGYDVSNSAEDVQNLRATDRKHRNRYFRMIRNLRRFLSMCDALA